MIIFLDENDVEYGALATIKATNAVNGERSLTGTIVSGDYVLSKIERGWRLRFDDEYYVVTYAKPIDEGKNVQVSFDAVHQFFWDFGKSSVYDQLSDGSHTFRAYLDFIFNGSGYKYDIETSLTVKAFEKQSFGYKNRLSLFNDIITSSGVEFQVNGKVVRILAKVGTDLSTVVRKNFNLNELGIEKNIGDFVTYQKGFGAYFDEEDHSKGRLIAEYTSPLASVYGKLEADPLVDERYKQPESLLSALKETVDNSYTISVSLDMEDLTRAGYRYTQPVAGDYIMAINETLGFKEKIRIVSFTSEYDVAGQLIKHTVTCNDIGSVKKLSASYTHTQHQAANAEVNANTAYEFANKALVSANGKNTNYYGDTFPVDNPKGTLKKGDLLFLTVGDTVKQYYWNGAEWVINPVVSDVEAFKEQIAEELKDVPNREEFENKIAEELANSKAEIETQIETAKTQAESNAKEYADTINQETAKVAEQAKTAADEIKADLVNVKNNLTDTSLVANNAQAAVDAAKQDLTEVANELSTAKQDLANSVTAVNTKVNSTKEELTQAKQELMSHAQQLQTQANAQTELTKRVTTVETTANGTKTTVNELTKTVAQNGKDITSVTNRTKTVEDDLANTKTTLTQVQTTANSASQKTATLETGLNGLNARFENLKVGAVNLLKNSKGPFQPNKKDPFKYDNWITYPKTTIYLENGSQYIVTAKTDGIFSNNHVNVESDNIVLWMTKPNGTVNKIISDAATGEAGTVFVWNYPTGEYCLRVNAYRNDPDKSVWDVQIEKGNVATDYSQNEADIESKVAEYKQTADQNYASLQSNLQTLDGTVKQNKSEFDQTANQIKSSISAVEGKIPTEIGGRNYIRNYGLTATGWIALKPAWKFEIISDSTAKSGQYLKATCTTASTGMGGFYKNLFDFSDGRFFGKQMTWAMDIKTSKNVKLNIGCEWGNAQTNVNVTENWQRFSKTFKVATSSNQKAWIFYSSNWEAGDIVYIRDVQLEDGPIATSPVPAIEDTESDISTLSSQIKQTADGMTLLATKTELNTAKNELQSGITTATNKANSAQSTANNNAQTISTHTNQISALNTGLQAKVSQTEFNTLSGRVTTAENNITAKANELSSKITSVEGKIPTSVGGRNLWIQSKATGNFVEETLPDNHITGQKKCYRISNNNEISFNIEPDFSSRLYRKVTFSAWVKYDNVTQGSNNWNVFNCFKHTLYYKNSSTGATTNTDYLTLKGFTGTSDWKYITYTYDYAKNKSYDQLKTSIRFNLESARSGTAWVTGVKIEIGSIPSDYSPAPEDTISQIDAVSSELKQTKDGITLLATKTELNNAKNDLQSGINTATNKANAAQNTANSAQNKANSNAQTISTHTNQISALNTGLQAKVSQSDFNTLSGRVTTAENNITAKANELSSKITSVEGKIPTSIGARNYIRNYGLTATGWIALKPAWKFEIISDSTAKSGQYLKATCTTASTGMGGFYKNLFDFSDGRFFGKQMTWAMDIKTSKNVKLNIGCEWGNAQTNVNVTENWQRFSKTFKVATSSNQKAWIFYSSNWEAGDIVYIRDVQLEDGPIATSPVPAPEDYDSKLASAQSEIKQTTDAIKASVQSLDNSTVKSSSLTINADGIVMKAGKSTTDVANAIGSYFSVNQNAINLFSDKINVKGNMIVSGAITSDKIASKQINTAHLNGKIITADVISSNAVTADAIRAGAVTTDKMSANSINGDRITAGTLDAAKIKAGSITASQIASGTITSNQIKAGGISSASIAAGAITTDKIAAGAIDANKIAANAITANMIRGGQLNSTNGATVFDLNAGTLTFNNNSGYIQRVAGDKIFEITTYLGKSLGNSQDYLTSDFTIRKSDNSRRSGIQFQLYTMVDNQPTATAKINADSLNLYNSQNTKLFSINGSATWAGNFNVQGWGDIPVAQVYGGLLVKDIGIGGHMKSLLKIVEELCQKTGIMWI